MQYECLKCVKEKNSISLDKVFNFHYALNNSHNIIHCKLHYTDIQEHLNLSYIDIMFNDKMS